MTSTRPASKHRDPAGAIHSIVVLVFVLLPTLLGLATEQKSRHEDVEKFHDTRATLLSQVTAAAARADLDTLLAMEQQYPSSVADRDFRSHIRGAIALATAKETEMKLAAARRLDLERQMTEVSDRPDLARPQLPMTDVKQPGQSLSVLPR